MFQTQFKKQTNSRLFFAICALAIGTSFASCSDEEVPKDQPRESEKVEFFIAATQGEAQPQSRGKVWRLMLIRPGYSLLLKLLSA